jgi:tRNA threonylcarbamoyladenosine biosynthesis protein TsaE
MTFNSTSTEETVARGRELARRLKPPVLVLLSGELGAGKTTLAKGIISGLNAAREEDVTSPTFTLVHLFGGPAGWPKVYHVDLYRVSDRHSFETLGLEDILDEPAIVLVEWPDRLAALGGRTDWPVVRVSLTHESNDARRIAVEGL